MNRRITLTLIVMASALAGCGGSASLRCDEHVQYKDAVDHKRITVPEGLTALDTSREMVLPEPSPHVPRAATAGCLDLPPTAVGRE